MLAAGAALVVAGCGGGSSSSSTGGSSGATPQKGGTLRLETQDFGFTDAFDPSGEYLGLAWGQLNQLMTRTLLSYKFVPGTAGNQLVPDIAESVPQPSSDGLTYTFKLKQGIKFGPPLNRVVTSKDIAFAIQRIATKSIAAQYPNYYQNIEGFKEYNEGKVKVISGIQTPDPNTITFKLTKPQGNFLYAMSLPASSPMPKEVAGCFTQAGEYGRYIVSTGPYMFQGADKMNASSCSTLKPISGFNPTKSMTWVRNPAYDPATDTAKSRGAYLDQIDLTINTNAKDIFDRIQQGQIDGSPDTPPSDVIQTYSTDSNLKKDLKVYDGDRTWFITMNLTQPPFDDIHVRKAVSFAIDKQSLLKAWGGPTVGKVATHIAPDTIYTGQFPAGYDPYPYDTTKAADEMKQSKYDTNKDGTCDASACKNLFFVTRNLPQWLAMNPIIEANLGKIGITLNARELPTSNAYTTIQTVSRNVPIAANPGWGKDFADAATFFVLLDGRNILPTGNTNYPLLGITPKQAGTLGVKLPAGGVPSVDAGIDACSVTAGTDRNKCFAALDQKTMETAVPWVPYQFANSVETASSALSAGYVFDQFSTEMSVVNSWVDQSKQK
jgi:peptide/nickel transport system substrate-binding protein